MVFIGGSDRAWYLTPDGEERECTVVTLRTATSEGESLVVIDAITGDRVSVPARDVLYVTE